MTAPQLAPGVALTLWHDDGLARALAGARALLDAARPAIVQLHAGPRELLKAGARVAAEVRALVPGVRLWCGVACDGWYRGYTAGANGRSAVVDALLGAATAADAIGAEAVVWNAEAAWKQYPDQGATIAGDLVHLVAQRYPRLVQGHTAYDHPGYHSTYPWAAWLGPTSPVALALPQVYAAPAEGRTAGRGALSARLEGHRKSWAAAVRAGWIRADLEVAPYLQAHHVPATQTCTEATDARIACLWAAPTRIDADGERAVRVLSELRRRGYGGAPGEARRAVVALGAASSDTDRVIGPRAWAAVGVG